MLCKNKHTMRMFQLITLTELETKEHKAIIYEERGTVDIECYRGGDWHEYRKMLRMLKKNLQIKCEERKKDY